jgi:hypothetical protein
MSNGKEINIQLIFLRGLVTSFTFNTVNVLGIISGVNLCQFKLFFTPINIKQITLKMHIKTHENITCLSVLYCYNNNWYCTMKNNTFVKLSCITFNVS